MNMTVRKIVMTLSYVFVTLLLCITVRQITSREIGEPFGLISRVQTECELEALRVGGLLADHYNSYDEASEWDARIHNDYLSQNLGCNGWIHSGTWKSGGLTATKLDSKLLHTKGGWNAQKNVSHSSYWSLENKWLYMMGDSTVRQVWASFSSLFQDNQFERNAKEWTRENCQRQYPHRKEHSAGGNFPEEGWHGNCGNNEVTCHLSGFGAEGKLSFDWKHFTYEDYDDWIWGEDGLWNRNDTRRPDIVVMQVGLHTCFHAFNEGRYWNDTLVRAHEADLPKLMNAIKAAINRPPSSNSTTIQKTEVIIMTSGRVGTPDPSLDRCTNRFNRLMARAAHYAGFAVLEREEIERRFLFKSEFVDEHGSTSNKYAKFNLHLQDPSPQIVGTSILTLISCLRKNVSLSNTEWLRHPMTKSLFSPEYEKHHAENQLFHDE